MIWPWKLLALALFIAVMVPSTIFVHWAVDQMSDGIRWFCAGIPAGMAISLALDKWDRVTRARQAKKAADNADEYRRLLDTIEYQSALTDADGQRKHRENDH